MIERIERVVAIVFKIGILILGVSFLLVYTWSAQNGRYALHSWDKIFDTRTGTSYLYNDVGKSIFSTNFTNGKVLYYPLKDNRRRLKEPNPYLNLPEIAPEK